MSRQEKTRPYSFASEPKYKGEYNSKAVNLKYGLEQGVKYIRREQERKTEYGYDNAKTKPCDDQSNQHFKRNNDGYASNEHGQKLTSDKDNNVAMRIQTLPDLNYDNTSTNSKVNDNNRLLGQAKSNRQASKDIGQIPFDDKGIIEAARRQSLLQNNSNANDATESEIQRYGKNLNDIQNAKQIYSEPNNLNNSYQTTAVSNQKNLGQSTESNKTYVSILPDPPDSRLFPKPILPPDRKKKFRKTRSRRVCGVVLVVLGVLAVVLAILLVYFFVIKKTQERSPCTKPEVLNGNVSYVGDTAQLDCDHGYRKSTIETVYCRQGKWSAPISCVLVDCNGLPHVSNGSVTSITSTFGSVGTLICDNGYMVSCKPDFVCDADVNWTPSCPLKCLEHPCGTYELPTYAGIERDFSYVNMTMKLKCDDGFSLTPNRDAFLKCENGTWMNDAECEIPGVVTLLPEETVFNSSSSMTLRCLVSNSPGWQNVLLTKSELSNSSQSTVLAHISNTTEFKVVVVSSKQRIVNYPVKDGVTIEVKFERLSCEDNGIYACNILVGDVDNPRDRKSVNRTVRVLEQSSTLPVLTAPSFSIQGTTINCSCNGSVGLDEDGKKLGHIILQLKYADRDTYSNMTPSVTQSSLHECRMVEYVEVTISVTNAMANATLRCSTYTTFNEPSLISDTQVLQVKTTKVNMSVSPSLSRIGSMTTIFVDIQNILGWKTIEMRKVCDNDETTASRLNVNGSVEDMTEHVDLQNSNFSESSAAFEMVFNSTRCSDACAKGSRANYTAAVLLINGWFTDYLDVEFFDTARSPIILKNPDKFYLGLEATITCNGDVGVPAQHLELLKNGKVLSGEMSTAFDTTTCDNNATIHHTFTVSDQDNDDEYVCVTTLENSTLSSRTVRVNVTEPVLTCTHGNQTDTGKRSKIICVLTEISNLTELRLYRGKANTPLCILLINGIGSCQESYYGIQGGFENTTKFVTVVNISEVRCIDDSTFSFSAIGESTITTFMTFRPTKNNTIPLLHLPTAMILNQKTRWDDILNCTAFLGYPAAGRYLNLHVKYKGTTTYVDYPQPSKTTGDCEKNATIELRQQLFDASFHESTIRCAIMDDTGNVIAESSETVKLVNNTCRQDEADSYYPHPYKCRRYLRCVNGFMYVYICAGNLCSKTTPPYDGFNICGTTCKSGCDMS